MKRFLVVLLLVSVLTTVTGCNLQQSGEHLMASGSADTLAPKPESGEAGISEESRVEYITESSKVQQQIDSPAGSRECELSVPDGGKIKMYLPQEWSVEGNAIIGDYTLAEVHSLEIVDDIDNLYKQLSEKYSGAEVTGDFLSNELEGCYYWLETEVESGGMTAKQNELIYFIKNANGKVLSISFYPAFGVGVNTQRENFELFLATLNM